MVLSLSTKSSSCHLKLVLTQTRKELSVSKFDLENVSTYLYMGFGKNLVLSTFV